LASGRDISLTFLEVSARGSFLEGYPSARWNDLTLAALVRSVADRFSRAGTFLLNPSRVRPEPVGAHEGPFGPVELLPPIQCVGVFRSHPIAEEADPAVVESSLAVVWYQQHPELPFDEHTRGELQGLDWAALARDHER
jgi:hypothetical protein